MTEVPQSESAVVKQCCANIYGSEAAKYLLGDSFHPGGLRLTGEIGLLLSLGTESLVLDVASGKGTSAIFLAEKFGCKVIGIDLSEKNVTDANAAAASHGLNALVTFRLGDAETLPFPAGIFDAILCECAFCTFPSKELAASEFERVLKAGGRVGISDITKDKLSIPGLDGLLAWISCIGDAQSLQRYADWLSSTGLIIQVAEQRTHYLREMVQGIRTKLLVAEVMSGLKKLDIPGLDLGTAKAFSSAAQEAIAAGELGYGIVVATKKS